MVTLPTVLVVGAGGSKPYGYPLGRELVDSLVYQLPRRMSPPGITDRLIGLGISGKLITDFRNDLVRSHRMSIDRFLSAWPDYVDLGKLAIAATLVPIEEPEMAHREGDWYRHLFNQLSENLDAGKKARLTILTFNYDRSLDFYLHTAFKHSYKWSDDETRQRMANLEIVHMHGSLSPLPWEQVKGKASRDYGDLTTIEWLRGAAQCIKVIHEQREGDPAFSRAFEALREADRVCFLGFGYDRTNIRRLLGGNWLKAKKYAHFIGSGFGFTGSEAERIMEQFDGVLKIVDGSSDCLMALRHHTYVLS